MEGFTGDCWKRSIIGIESVNKLFLPCSIMILLQFTTMTNSSIAPLVGHHLRHYSPQGLHSPVRWTKTSQNSHQGRPVDVMTDVINDLGVKILDRYVDNTGNVAFSPSGLGFVLVALYEGSAGSSNREISDVLSLPRDRRVTRIGLRDIHRRLRSYLNADAFLGGLTLNRDDINLRPDYEDILRFYGFDISDSGIDSNLTMDSTMNSTDSSNSITTMMTSDSSTIANSNDTTTVEMDTTSLTSMGTTITSIGTTISDDAVVITDMTGGTNSALSMAPPSGVFSTSIPTTLTIMSQTAVTNSTSTTNSPGMAPGGPNSALSMAPPGGAFSTSIPTTLTIMSQTAVTNSTSTTNSPGIAPGGPNSALSMAPPGGVFSTSIPTTLTIMSQTAMTNFTSTTNSPGTTPMSSGSTINTGTPITASSTILVGVQGDSNGMAGTITNGTDATTGSSTNGTNGSNMDSTTGSSTNATTGSSTNGTNGSSTNSTTGSSTNATTGSSTNAMTGSSTNDTNGSSTNGTIGSSTDATDGSSTNGTNSSSINATTGSNTNATTGSSKNGTNGSSTTMLMQSPVGSATEAADVQTKNSDASASSTNPTIPMKNSDTNPMTILTSPMTILMTTSAESLDNIKENLSTTKMEDATKNIVEDTATNTVRKRRGILHGPSGYFSSSADDGIWLDVFGRLNNHDDYQSQDEDIGVDPRRPTEVAFLVNGCDYSRVTAAAYTAFLPFSYFPSLRASLLEFPLDDPRYKILVMLPSDENGTRRLARILATKPITLRRLRRSLQSTWVTAIIPSFMLRGFVTLTPYLQRLGISDVFDPRAADLTPMSPDLGVYAQDIQQSIGVNIRNNVKGGIGGADGGNEEQKSQQRDDLVRSVRGVGGIPPFFVPGGAISPRSRGYPHYPSYPGAGNPLYERAPPVPFVVDRPFLYFIIDDETSVTLLAGRIDDPLNSRML